ncbi:MAG: tRNA pseudouridine(38-40) synthase TruA [Myxococcota bacterium]
MQYRLVVEYDGGEFHGWQLQPNARTVQGTLEAAIERFLGYPARASAAGRTDAGVHAAGQVVCFQAEAALSVDTVRRALNALTPRDLVVRAVDVVPDSFDPRRSACWRRYEYRIWNRRSPSPFWRRHAWHIPWDLDADRMHTAAGELLGEHDFSTFRAAGCDAAHAIRRVHVSAVTRRDAMILYEVEATAFLRHMVRNIVGTLVEIGSGRRSPALATLLAARDRGQAAATAPAHGLCLTDVGY